MILSNLVKIKLSAETVTLVSVVTVSLVSAAPVSTVSVTTVSMVSAATVYWQSRDLAMFLYIYIL